MLFPFRLLAASAALLGHVGRVAAYANPGSCSGECWTHDPAVVRRSDGTYFRFSTGNKIGIYTASSLEGPWTLNGSAIPAGSSINLEGRDDLWAPDVQLVGDTYHLYYSTSTFGSQNSAIGYATSTTLEPGSWTDHGRTGVTSSSGSNYNAIDANVVSANGTYYMNFGSFWGDIFQVPLNSVAKQNAGSETNIAFTSANSQAREGSFMWERNGYYYLFFSDGQCCGYDNSMPARGNEYKIKVCRSTSPTGPFTDKSGVSCMAGGGTVVLESHGTVYGPGGQGIFADPTHGTVLYYHYVDTTVGHADGDKKFGWNQIGWSTGWPVV